MKYDIVIFGATSFVGKLAAEYLLSNHAKYNIALAGRDEEKLRALEFDAPLIVADATDVSAVRAMVDSAKVVISTVGPYTYYGDHVVEACAKSGTHYVDLCGEALFIRRSIDSWHDVAQQTGAAIVHSCGFDSVPSDMGMFHLHQKFNMSFDQVVMAVEHLSGGLSGGTIESMRAVSKDAKEMKNGGAILHSPYSLSPDHKHEPDLGEQKDFQVCFDELAGQWTGPFFMSMFNTRVVRRSNALQGYAYGDKLRYREAMGTGKGIGGRLRAIAIAAATAFGFAAVQNPRLSRFLPQPGDGPKDINSGGFAITFYGRSVKGGLYTAAVHATGDPGYKVTAMMLGEAAVQLVRRTAQLGGVLTPATALGTTYRDALHKQGMRFS
ncbi:MAG: saccharopine dehydrogenase NADP-binding domain-containing protein [Corynebacterium sp.]|nr:saccharopine dehydrogenase NADP-binding domain-containing protein [Corynebacterium sp.]